MPRHWHRYTKPKSARQLLKEAREKKEKWSKEYQAKKVRKAQLKQCFDCRTKVDVGKKFCEKHRVMHRRNSHAWRRRQRQRKAAEKLAKAIRRAKFFSRR